MKTIQNVVPIISILSIMLNVCEGGPIMAGSAVAACYSACNAGYVTCMAASGLVAGVSGPVGWFAWLTGAATACSGVQGTCMATCCAGAAASLFLPTP